MGSIKEQLITLVALQKAELKISDIEIELAGIDERINMLNQDAFEYEARVTAFLDDLKHLKKEYRSNENEIRIIDTQIAKSREKLRVVKTNKEYQSILKEIDESKLKSSQIEDRMLDFLERIEVAEGQVETQKVDLTNKKNEIEGKQNEILQMAESQRQELEHLQQERQKIWDNVPEKLQSLYNRVKKQGHGIAVAAILDSVCQVCRMNIPPQLYNELHRFDDLRMCPNCQRIIYPHSLIEIEDN